MKHSILAGAAAAVALLLALPGARVSADVPANAKTEQGQRDFVEIARVLQSPRCRNCHPSGEAPLQGDDKPHHHAMNISRASVAAGMRCATCHREANNGVSGGPPGAKGWNMPSADIPMVFEGKTPHDLCVQLTDPTKTSGRTPDQIKEHMNHDALVLWAWSPGEGRAAPPITHDELMKRVDGWVSAGTPCPN